MNNDQLCIVTRNVIENDFKINHFQHWKVPTDDQPSSWLFMHGDEEDGFMNEASNISFVKLSEVILNQPFIREYLDKPVGSRFGYCPTHGRMEDWTEKRTLTFDRKIIAPNATNVKFEPLTWLKYFPGDITLPIIALTFIILAAMFHPIFLLVTIYLGTLSFARWMQLREHFKFGSSLPGMIISTRPTLVAVEFKLENQDQRGRYLKVIKTKVKKVDGKSVEKGDKIATATLFEKRTWYSTKFDMTPLPVNYATGSSEKIDGVMQRFLPNQWESLNEAISLLEEPCAPGLFSAPLPMPETSDFIEEADTIV